MNRSALNLVEFGLESAAIRVRNRALRDAPEYTVFGTNIRVYSKYVFCIRVWSSWWFGVFCAFVRIRVYSWVVTMCMNTYQIHLEYTSNTCVFLSCAEYKVVYAEKTLSKRGRHEYTWNTCEYNIEYQTRNSEIGICCESARISTNAHVIHIRVMLMMMNAGEYGIHISNTYQILLEYARILRNTCILIGNGGESYR